jgi:hypothetical protein
MEMHWISDAHDRPRCIGTDAQGRRCREPVLWDDLTNRPVSTRCQAYGGLADAALMSWQSLDPADMPNKVRAGTGDADAPPNSPKTVRTKRLGRSLGGLPVLILAGALCLAMAGPALADFESAVSAYDRGDYTEARSEFQSLAAAGDERAQPYLDRIRRNLRDDNQSSGSLTPTLMDTVTSIFGESETSSDDSGSGAIRRGTESSAAGRSAENASGKKPADWEPWSPFDQATEPASAPPPVSDVVIPQRRSIWSTIFHLPGDATVIGLQYVAQSLSADNLSRELQFISRHSDKIALSILASLWWLVIIKGVVGIGAGISRFMKVATTVEGQKRYG